MRQATNGGGVVCLYVCWVQRWTLHNGWTNRYAVREACPFGPKEQMRCAYWRHLLNTIEWCVRCGFTSNYCDHLFCYIVVGRWQPQHIYARIANENANGASHCFADLFRSGLQQRLNVTSRLLLQNCLDHRHYTSVTSALILCGYVDIGQTLPHLGFRIVCSLLLLTDRPA